MAARNWGLTAVGLRSKHGTQWPGLHPGGEPEKDRFGDGAVISGEAVEAWVGAWG